MKKTHIILLAILLTGCESGPFIERRDAKSGIKASQPLIEAIDSSKQKTGLYPKSIEELQLSRSVLDELKEHEIRYTPFDYNGKPAYAVGFTLSGVLLTPHCVYGSFNGTWQCSGK